MKILENSNQPSRMSTTGRRVNEHNNKEKDKESTRNKTDIDQFNGNIIPTQIINATTTQLNTNLKENYPHGNYLRHRKPSWAVRIWLQNINGLRYGESKDKLKTTLERMKELNIDVLALPEINTPYSKEFQADCTRLGRKICGPFKCSGASSDEPSIGKYQPGGVGILARGKIVGRISRIDYDRSGLGRWAYIKFGGKQKKQLWIIVGYRVCKSTKVGTETAYSQQVRILRRQGVDNPDPRKRWNEDMKKFLQQIPKGDEILLLVDFNGKNTDEDFGQLLAETNLYDLMTAKHGSHIPATYIRGSAAVDHAVGTKGVLLAIDNIGLVEFLKYFQSDHRGLYVDLFVTNIFAGLLHPLQRKDARKVQIRNKDRRIKYLQQASVNINQQQIIQKMTTIVEAPTDQQQLLVEKELDGLYDSFHQCLKDASDALPRYPLHWWTPAVKTQYKLVKYWEAAVSFHNCKLLGNEALEYIKSKIPDGVDIYQGDPTRTVRSQLRLAVKNLKKERTANWKDRQSMLRAEAEKKVKEKDPVKRTIKVQKIIESMRRTESRLGMFQKMQDYLKGSNASALTHVDVPDEEGLWKWMLPIWHIHFKHTKSTTWLVCFNMVCLANGWDEVVERFGKYGPHRRVVEKEELGKQLAQYHKRHFSQAQGTPFTTPPLSNLFGEHLETSFTQDFIEGKAAIDDIEGINEETKQFLKALVPTPLDPPSIDVTITTKNIEDGFNIWKEKTTTSPMGNHLGLYKAWLTNYDEEDDILPKESVLRIIEQLLNLSMKYNKPFQSWRPTHNLYLCKQLGNYKIHRLRMLHILDALLNLERREIITRRLMQNAERHGYITDNQWGGRNGRCAIDVPTLKAYTLEIFYLIRANAAFTDCDARACYDRMVAILTGLIQHKAGLPLNACSYFIKVLKQMTYHMTTAYGLTEETNSHTPENPVHGSGQGATNAPPDWGLTSHICLDQYSKKAHGCTISDPTEEIIQQRDADMFVDDMSAQHNGGRYDHTEEELMQMTHHDINAWDRTLNIAGGLLESLKSGYSMLIWEYEDNGTPVLKEESKMKSNSVYLTREGGNISLKRHKVTEGIKMIGVHKALSLQEDSALAHIRTKTKNFTIAINSCPLPKCEVLPAYFSIFIPSISYIFPATAFTELELEQLHKILLPKLLPRCGYKYNFPYAVALASSKFLGIGLYHLKAFHLAIQIETIIMHLRSGNSVGTTAMIMLRWAQLSAGISTPILEDHGRLPYLEGSWIPNLRDGLITINGKLVLTNPWVSKRQRINDMHIMDAIRRDSAITDQQIKELNYCRMFLRVELLSDITTSDGTRLIPLIYSQTTGERLDNQLERLKWPRQQTPGRKVWKMWNKTILRVCSNGFGKLQRPLGEWIRVTKAWRQYYDSENNQVYRYNNGQWRKHQNTHVTRRKLEVHQESTPTTLPRKLTPITDLQKRPSSPFFISSVPTQVILKKKQQFATFWQFIASLPEWEQVLLTSFRETSHFMSLDDHLKIGTELWFVTDGGVKGPLGYYGWVIATASEILWEGKGHSQSNPDLVESLRTESSGLLALGRFLLRRIQYFEIPTTIKQQLHYCDNSTFQKRMSKFLTGVKLKTRQYLLADMDVQMQIEDTFRQMNLTITSHHVKGHQDRKQLKEKNKDKDNEKTKMNKKKKKFSWQARLNIRADQLATAACSDLYNTSAEMEFCPLPAAKAYLYIEDKPITRNIRPAVNNAWTTQDLRQHLKERFGWKDNTASLVDWYACGSILEGSKKAHFKRFIVRYTHRRLEVNAASFNIAAINDKCPFCPAQEETHDHFLTCSGNPEQWTNFIDSITETYKQLEIDPVLRILINMVMNNSSINKIKAKHPTIKWKEYKSLIDSQTQIGWYQIKYGRFSLEWHVAQQRYETIVKGKTDQGAPKWLRKIIRQIWNFAKNRWLARCNRNFGKEDSSYNTLRDLLYQRIVNLYAQEQHLLQQDRHPFHHSLEYWKTSNVTTMQRWLKIQQPFVTYCLRLVKQQRNINAGDIRKFYNKDKDGNPTKSIDIRSSTKRKMKRKKSNVVTTQHKDIRTIYAPVTKASKYPKHQQNKPTTSQFTEYYSDQDRPPDPPKVRKVQHHIGEYFHCGD